MILKNRIYLGDICHHDLVYPGAHEAIVPQELWDAVQEHLRSNSKNRKRGVRATESSLLAGCVFDAEGHRLIPSHANKRGKRYRYYVVRKDAEGDGYKPVKISVPVHDLESTVVGAIVYWLEDASKLLKDLRLKRCATSSQEAVMLGAASLAESIRGASPLLLRDTLTQIVGRITVGNEDIEIQLRRSGVLALVEPGKNVGLGDEDSRDAIVIWVQASLQRSGLEMKLVVAESWAESTSAKLDWALIKAVARSHHWMQQLTSGQVSSVREICRIENLGEVYVRLILGCATLAPNIVDAILEGRQPAGLTLRNITSTPLPLLWAEQQQRYGVSDD